MSGHSRRGFASMDPERRRECSQAGNEALNEYGTRYQWTPEQQRAAAAKGRESQRLAREARKAARP